MSYQKITREYEKRWFVFRNGLYYYLIKVDSLQFEPEWRKPVFYSTFLECDEKMISQRVIIDDRNINEFKLVEDKNILNNLNTILSETFSTDEQMFDYKPGRWHRL